MEAHGYVMCAHVFGALSSAICSNYALHRTVVENEAAFGEIAASALHHNLCVDDLLKSIEVLDLAKQFVEDAIIVWKPASFGFHLTKFISNNKELLLPVPEHQRIMGVKDQNLSGDLSNEKALEICWNLREDIFSFKLKVEAGTLTKIVLLSIISSVYDPLEFAAPFFT